MQAVHKKICDRLRQCSQNMAAERQQMTRSNHEIQNVEQVFCRLDTKELVN